MYIGFTCCVHRLRRVDTGLRNTDITNAHGWVIHGSFIPIILGFKSAFGAILKDFGRYASLVGERKQRGELARQNPFKSVPKAHKIKYIKGLNP